MENNFLIIHSIAENNEELFRRKVLTNHLKIMYTRIV
jgi:hypothetical protein